MFCESCAFFADAVAVVGLVILISVSAPALVRWARPQT
jgi:hypothetical protein